MPDSQLLDADTALTPRFNENECFDIFCATGGSVDKVVQYFNTLPEEQRRDVPARTTLFRYAQLFNWRERYERIRTAIIEQSQEEVAMSYKRINTVAGIALAGLTRRLHKAYEKEDDRAFNPKMLEILWAIQRVERGLPTAIRHSDSHERVESFNLHAHVLEARPDLIERVRGMDIEQLKALATMLNVAEPPAILKKRND